MKNYCQSSQIWIVIQYSILSAWVEKWKLYIERPNNSVKIKKLAGPFVFQLFQPFRGYCVLNKSVKLSEVMASLLEAVVVKIWQNFSFHCVKCWKIVTSWKYFLRGLNSLNTLKTGFCPLSWIKLELLSCKSSFFTLEREGLRKCFCQFVKSAVIITCKVSYQSFTGNHYHWTQNNCYCVV